MRTLGIYWKIFIWFWLTMVAAILLIGWLSLRFTQDRYLPLGQNALITNYGITAVITYQSGDKPALRRWFNELSRQFHLQGYLLDDDGNDVLNRHLTGSLLKIRNQILQGELPAQAIRSGSILVSPSIVASDGRQYRFIAERSLTIDALQYFHISDFVYGLLISIFLIGLVCYFLSLYLLRPVTTITQASQQLASGDLSVRIPIAFTKRRDELGTLADEFNHMATQLDQLVSSQHRLLQDVSHELRTPLARLQIALELARKQTGGLAKKELNRIELEAQRLNELIGQILSVARMNSQEYQLECSQIDLVELLKQIITDIGYENTAEEKRIHCQWPTQCIYWADRKLLHSAFDNILRNALRYTPAPGIIEVYLYANEENVHLSIRDHGPGVPHEKLPFLFKAFYRVDDARSKGQGGYGLGLAIVKQAIELHRGSISAVNALDGGLIINIDFPKEMA